MGFASYVLPLPWEGDKSPSWCAATLRINTLEMAKQERGN